MLKLSDGITENPYNKNLNSFDFGFCLSYGRIIKWTQHVGFSILTGMERVVEGNHGNDSKEG